jgi:hypothetical protein
MLRKTLVTLATLAILGASSAAMARGGGGGWGGGGWAGGGGGWGGGAGMRGMGGPAMHGVGMGHPMAAVRGMGFSPNHVAWGHDHFHNFGFHHRFRNRFFAFGFGGPYLYDYAYNSCWTQIPTRYGWRWVYACSVGAY